ncbi:hypothetical protein SDC9_145362 [bioreactor metagenome]|uniref:Acyltransferase 3 domain-containing protein n=1 Tax=bioreactor metagenome TaxID=1076179 RepID=A0A645E9U3_9ZZZZ
MLGQLGVNCFMLISGYFLLESNFKWIKVIKISLEASFYILLGIIFLKIFGDSTGIAISWWQPKVFFPILKEAYWFLTVYVLIYLFSPILKKLISILTEKQFKIFLGLSLFIWSIWPTIFGFRLNQTEGYIFYNRFIWGIIMFLIGAYIKKYPPKFFDSSKKANLFFLSSTLLILLPILLINFLKISGISANYFWRPNSVLMLIWSLSLFLFFRKLEIENKIINLLASTTLGVYLFHDGPIRYLLWNDIFKIKNYTNLNYFGFYLILVSLLLFLIGFGLDMGRKFLEKMFLDNLFDKIKFQKLLEVLDSYEEK